MNGQEVIIQLEPEFSRRRAMDDNNDSEDFTSDSYIAIESVYSSIESVSSSSGDESEHEHLVLSIREKYSGWPISTHYTMEIKEESRPEGQQNPTLLQKTLVHLTTVYSF